MELFLHKGVSTYPTRKYTTSLQDIRERSILTLQTSMENDSTFGSAPESEPFSFIPNHKLIRHYSLAHTYRYFKNLK